MIFFKQGMPTVQIGTWQRLRTTLDQKQSLSVLISWMYFENVKCISMSCLNRSNLSKNINITRTFLCCVNSFLLLLSTPLSWHFSYKTNPSDTIKEEARRAVSYWCCETSCEYIFITQAGNKLHYVSPQSIVLLPHITVTVTTHFCKPIFSSANLP